MSKENTKDIARRKADEEYMSALAFAESYVNQLAAARAEALEEAAQIAERVTSFSDNLQKSAGCLTTGQAIAAAIRAKLEEM